MLEESREISCIITSIPEITKATYIPPRADDIQDINGCGKLKMHGFSFREAVSGFSNKIIWLNVRPGNNNSAYVEFYLILPITILERVPRVIRAAIGSKNMILCGVQRFCFMPIIPQELGWAKVMQNMQYQHP